MTSDHRSADHRSADHHTASPHTADRRTSDCHASDRHTPDHPGDLLTARLDEELDPATARTVDLHLASCTDCAAELDELSWARRTMRQLPRVAAPAGFVDRLVEERRRADRRGVALAGVAAGLVVVMGLAAAEPLDRSEPAGRDLGRDDGIVRFESRQVDDGDPGRSLGDRAYAAAADLIEFLSG